MNENQAVLVSLISAISGIVIAYIVNIAAKRVQQKKKDGGPIDRMEQMFDGYERLIKQKDLEDDRKAKLIESLEAEIAMTREIVRKLESALETAETELRISREDNADLKDMLAKMREEYEELKKNEQEKK